MKPAHAPRRRTGAAAAAAVEVLEARLLFFGTDLHQDLTASALNFLNSSVLATINDQHRVQDKVDPNGDTAAYHFDGSYFNEGATAINSRYRTIQDNSNPSAFNSATVAREFGKIMHAVQDFYAHSNWVETGLTTLVDGGNGFWNALAPYTIRSGAIMIEGENQHPSISPYGTASFSRSGHQVKVTFPGGVTLPGIISGAWEQEKLPDNIEVHHDYLNKDYPDRAGYSSARDLAVKQSKHEFARLGALIGEKYGSAGVDKLLAAWVKPDSASQSAARALVNQVPGGGPGGGRTSTFIAAGATWKYLDNGSNQGSAWRGVAFSDSGWKSGNAQLGYGDGDEATKVSFGPNNSNKFVTTYFRKSFSVADASKVTALSLKLLRDDGAVVYLNGTEVYRSNMPGGTISYTTLAASTVESNTWYSNAVDRGLLRSGSNVISVEIHQADRTSSDISFDFSLAATVTTTSQSASSPLATPAMLSPTTKVISLVNDLTKPLI